MGPIKSEMLSAKNMEFGGIGGNIRPRDGLRNVAGWSGMKDGVQKMAVTAIKFADYIYQYLIFVKSVYHLFPFNKILLIDL